VSKTISLEADQVSKEKEGKKPLARPFFISSDSRSGKEGRVDPRRIHRVFHHVTCEPLCLRGKKASRHGNVITFHPFSERKEKRGRGRLSAKLRRSDAERSERKPALQHHNDAS